MKTYINSLNMFWNQDGELTFTNINWAGQSNKKQSKALESLLKKIAIHFATDVGLRRKKTHRRQPFRCGKPVNLFII